MTEPTYTGGCQCGAVRFALDGPLGRASICHCRMCQKAVGGFFVACVGGASLRWTRGEPAYFQSSNKAKRGFCRACGTPLAFGHGRFVEVAIGALDAPAAVCPAVQMRVESRMPWFAELAGLPEVTPDQTPWQDGTVSYQHPDHDTDAWPPAP